MKLDILFVGAIGSLLLLGVVSLTQTRFDFTSMHDTTMGLGACGVALLIGAFGYSMCGRVRRW